METNGPSAWGGAAKFGTTGQPPALPPMCHKCRRVIDPEFTYCPHCGQRQDAGAAWYYHPVWILLLAFTVLGPLVLPLVWRSQLMSRTGKILTAAAILVYTAVGVYVLWLMGAMYWRYFSEFGDVMGQIHPRR